MLVGIAGGLVGNALFAETAGLDRFIAWVARPVGQIFLRLLFMLVVPLIFSALALGVAGLGDLGRLGRIGLRTLAYTVIVSSIAVGLGIGLVHLFQPGRGLSDATRARLVEGAAERASGLAKMAAPANGMDLIVQIVPSNPIRAAADGDMLAVIFFSLLFGVGLALGSTEGTRALTLALEGLLEVSMRLIALVIRIAPIGVAALLFTLTADLGAEILIQLSRYVLVVLLALALHQFVVFSLAVRFFGGMSPRRFFSDIREAILVAFSTSSSNATLPTALRVAEERLRLPPTIARFVLTVGATGNQNGTALYEGVTVLFLAQFYGVDLTLAQETLVVLVCILGGIGTAGVPSGSLPVIAMILGMVRVPPEGIGLIVGVDRFLDMCRTTLNVTGDLVAAVVVAHGEPSSANERREGG